MTARRVRAAPDRRAPLPGILLLAAVLVGACGAATVASPQGPASGAPATAGETTATDSSPSPSASDASAEGPSPTSWPGDVVEAVVILGKADADIKNAGADLGAAAAYEDLKAMWGAADGLATLIERLQGQVDRIRGYPLTAPVAKAYDAAFPDMLAGAKKVRDSITAGDAAGITAGVEQLGTGTLAYEDARRQIAPLVEPALLMQRVLVK